MTTVNKPIITLLTDLGTRDASVSMAKAVLLQHAPGARVTDVTHRVPQHALIQAAYLLLSAYPHFPKGTIHIVPIDVFNGETPRILLAKKEGYWFIAPDNGLLPLAFGDLSEDVWICFENEPANTFGEWMHHAGKIVAQIATGSTLPFTPQSVDTTHRILQPIVTAEGVDCNVLHIDPYQNVVLDITQQQFETIVGNRPFTIKTPRMKDITGISRNYSDVAAGEPLCRFNSAGFLEIALNHGCVAPELGLDPGNPRYEAIKIFF